MAILYYYIDAQKQEQLSFEHTHIKKDNVYLACTPYPSFVR